MSKLLKAASSPHIRHQDSTAGIMLDVFFALLPAAAFGCVIFGLKALWLLLTTIATAILAEYLWNLILKSVTTLFS